ncbi:neuroblastoma breakpoint family member 4-like [Nycticebus coucang]|uniref:neuroblastoma breakpoint family member 4-like n=1 Tax=Nycticebus coucang TaxID=9470 RepID=UPI00234C252B|nr:neuroblastoma breakpoint family member 4-like [Nycticebus coucang]
MHSLFMQCCVQIHEQARELTQLCQQLWEGTAVSSSLSEHLQTLLTQEGDDNHQEEVAEGLRLAESLTGLLSPENPEEVEVDQEPLDDQNSEFNFLVEAQWRELKHLYYKLQAGRAASSSLTGHLQAIVSHDHPDCSQGQGRRQHLAEGRRLVNHLAHLLSPETYEDEEDEEVATLASSFHSELQEGTVNALSEALNGQDVPPSGGPDMCGGQEHLSGASTGFLSEESEGSTVLEGAGEYGYEAAPMQDACLQGPWSEDLSPQVSEVQASNTQLQKSTPEANCLQLQLNQHWDCGHDLAMWSIPCTPWSLFTSADSGHQWLLLPAAQPSLTTLTQTVSVLLAAPGVLKQTISKRTLLVSKWRLTCSSPGLQLRVQRYQVLLEL